MIVIEVIIALMLTILCIGLFFTRSDTRETNIHLAKIKDTLQAILDQIKEK